MSAQPESRAFAPLLSSRNWGGRITRAEVNLDAIIANVRALKGRAGGAQLLAVVKADGYGHGAIAVARSALEGGADRLGVYTVDEAVSLRQAGIDAPILVFGPFSDAEAGSFWTYGVTPTITSLEAAKALQMSSPGGRLRFHVKVDTGLTRAGVEVQHLTHFVRTLDQLPALEREGIFSHFARADERNKESAHAQFVTFRRAVEEVEEEGYPFPLKHIANSGAIHDFPQAYMGMVRSGISVYGYYPSHEVGQSVPLRPSLSLVSAVTRVHRAAKGTGIGYGHEHVCTRDTDVALIPIGYGDGLPRTFGYGNGRVIVNGQVVPVLARVSMDQITVDVSRAGPVKIGDTATLIGEQGTQVQTADDVAQQTGTINYDVLTGLMPRVPRLYASGDQLVSVARHLPKEPVPLPEITQQSP